MDSDCAKACCGNVGNDDCILLSLSRVLAGILQALVRRSKENPAHASVCQNDQIQLQIACIGVCRESNRMHVCQGPSFFSNTVGNLGLDAQSIGSVSPMLLPSSSPSRIECAHCVRWLTCSVKRWCRARTQVVKCCRIDVLSEEVSH